MKNIKSVVFFFLTLSILQASGFAQNKYFTKSGSITLDASGAMEDIKAENKKGELREEFTKEDEAVARILSNNFPSPIMDCEEWKQFRGF